jgi:WD40 repeat protein
VVAGAVNRSRKLVLGLAGVLGVAVCVSVAAVLVGQGLAQASLWAGVLGAPVGLLAAGAAWWPLVAQQPKTLAPATRQVPEWVVDRPTEISSVVGALLRRDAGMTTLITGLHGAGGFGKTTLALMVCSDRRVRRRFRGHVYMVTVGRDARGAAAIAAKVNDVIKLIAGENATFIDPQLAGQRLGALLDTGPPRLIVLDDVWEPEQLAPFADGGRRCARLVTTRVPGLLGRRGTSVLVDQMSQVQARALLTAGLPPLDPSVTDGLLAVTGRWPLLLRLASKILARATLAGADASAAGAQLLHRLEAGGPAVVDDISGEANVGLEVGEPQERARAVRATIEASTSLLDLKDAERFAELAIFAEGEMIPFSLAARLWRALGGLDEMQASQLSARLAELALISFTDDGLGGMILHDVVRDFLRSELGMRRLAELNDTLLAAVAADLPAADPLGAMFPVPPKVAWWELDGRDRYLWDHLIEHLMDAGRRPEAEGVAGDLRWAGARLHRFGSAAPAADLSLVGTQRALRLRTALTRTAHLLAPTQPTEAVVDILHSRVADHPDWRAQVTALRDRCGWPRLVNRWPLPDLPSSALRCVLVGHSGTVAALAISPDGSWLASGSDDGTVRIWDAETWQEQAALSGHTGWVSTVAISPDGSWLATGSSDETVRTWDAATGQGRAVLTSHGQSVNAVAIAPDGSWLATVSSDGTVWFWDVATGQEGAVLIDTGGVLAVAIAPDGSWLATVSSDRTVRIWDAATGRQRAVLTGHSLRVNAVAIAPDGSWLATGSSDGTVRIWDAVPGQQRVSPTSHKRAVLALEVAGDGSWLATGSSDETVRIWDAATGQERAVLTDTGGVLAVAIGPDGSWLATGSYNGTVRIWDAATGRQRAVHTGHSQSVNAVAIAPDGSWLATGSMDGTVRIWDAATGHSQSVNAVAIAPDGSWLATGSSDRTIRICDATTGRFQALMRVENAILACSWIGARALAAGGPEGIYLFDFLPASAGP